MWPSSQERIRYAGFWRRALAALLDLVILAVPVAWIVKAYLTARPSVLDRRIWLELKSDARTYGERERLEEALTRRVINSLLLVLLLPGLYYIPTESSPLRGTLGKRIAGLRVTDIEGRKIGFGRAIKRYFYRMLSTSVWLVGFVMAAFTAKKQTLHDILAGTVVVEN